MNSAVSLLATPIDEYLATAAARLLPDRPRTEAAGGAGRPVIQSASPTPEHGDEESGCACRNCTGKGDCGRHG